MLEAIDRLGRKPGDLKRIALTTHRSHLGGVAALKRATGATLLGHAWEADIVSGDRPAQSVGLKPTRPLKTYPFQVGIFLNRPRHAPCPVDEGSRTATRPGRCRCSTCRGSPGHLGFYWPNAAS